MERESERDAGDTRRSHRRAWTRRGSWPGELHAAAGADPPAAHRRLHPKLLEPKRREVLAQRICDRALAWRVAWADVEEIDALNILGATLLAMRRAVLGAALCGRRWCRWMATGCRCSPTAATQVEGGGEAAMRTVAAISAASILAKEARDALMPRAGAGLSRATSSPPTRGTLPPAHLAAAGAAAVHRPSTGMSFAPVRRSIGLGRCRT